jgi:DNA replication protein DnaC
VSDAVASPLPEMLGRLKLTAMRNRLDSLLDEAVRRDLTLAEALALLCEAEVAHREERRIQMGLSIAKFPYLRTLDGFDFAAQPSLDPKQLRELAACRWVANGDTLLILNPAVESPWSAVAASKAQRQVAA